MCRCVHMYVWVSMHVRVIWMYMHVCVQVCYLCAKSWYCLIIFLSILIFQTDVTELGALRRVASWFACLQNMTLGLQTCDTFPGFYVGRSWTQVLMFVQDVIYPLCHHLNPPSDCSFLLLLFLFNLFPLSVAWDCGTTSSQWIMKVIESYFRHLMQRECSI